MPQSLGPFSGAGLTSVAVVLCLLPTRVVHALGFRIPNQDAEAIARGNAFAATADNPSAIYYNPAGIAQLDRLTVQFGAHSLAVNSSFESASAQADTESEIQPVPQFYAVYPIPNTPLTLGFGVYAPFGLGLEWPEDNPFRNLAVEGRLLYSTIAPVIAWRVHPKLSIAAGPTINFASAMLRRGIGVAPGDEFRFRGNGFAYGAKAGFLWDISSEWSVGASYVSPTTVNFRGQSSALPIVPGKSGTSAEFEFPQFAIVGVSYRPTPRWNFEVGLDWTDWDTLDTATFKGTAFGDAPFPLNWESSVLVHCGATRKLRGGYWLGAGYFYSQNSTSDPDFNPIVPDTELHVGSLGFGYRGEKWSLGLSGQLITGPSRQIQNGTAADGSYQFFNQAVNFSVAYRF